MNSPVNAQGIRRDAGRQRAVPAILLCTLLTACGSIGNPFGVFASGSGQRFDGMVAADEPRAAMIGRDVLAAGGTAADAVVAMSFALTVTLPSQAGIAAGGVCMIYDHDKNKVETLNFVPPNPMIPGLPRGMYALSAKYGRLRWGQLVAPAESMARLGAPVSRAFARQIGPVAGTLLADDAARRVYAKADGQPVGEGDILVQSTLGATLSRLRTRGVGDIYAGSWADSLVASVTAAGGSLTSAELRDFLAKWQSPVALPGAGETLYLADAPAAGPNEVQLWNGHVAEVAPQAAAGGKSGTGLVAVDGNGSAVACSIGLGEDFGARRLLPDTGLVLPVTGSGRTELPGLGPILAVDAGSKEFRYAAAAGGGTDAPAVMVRVARAALVDGAALGHAVAEAGRLPGEADGSVRVNAIRCASGGPSSGRCQAETDPHGFGLALTAGNPG